MFDDLVNKEFRDAFLSENIRNRLAFQVRALREKYQWSQPQLAERTGKTQSVISRIEDPNYGRFTINTLLELASAFDVALFVSFIPYTKLIAEISDVSPQALAVASYEEEKEARETTAAIAASAAAPSQQIQRRSAYDAARPQETIAANLERKFVSTSAMFGGLRSGQQTSREIRQ